MHPNMIWTLKQLHLSMEQYGKSQMQNTDLTLTQANLLYYLLTHKEQGSCGIQLHAALGISKSSISAILKRLRLKGYLYLRENPSDVRKKQIILTTKAYEAEEKIYDGLLMQQKLLCNQIPEQRLEQLGEDMKQMLRNLKSEMEEKV